MFVYVYAPGFSKWRIGSYKETYGKVDGCGQAYEFYMVDGRLVYRDLLRSQWDDVINFIEYREKED